MDFFFYLFATNNAEHFPEKFGRAAQDDLVSLEFVCGLHNERNVGMSGLFQHLLPVVGKGRRLNFYPWCLA